MSTLVTALLDLAMRIAKAIVRRLAKWSIKRVVTWMRKRIDVFHERLERAATDRRRRWLKGRIERWTKAADWIEARALHALGEAAREVCRMPAFHKLPEWAPCEKAVA